MIRAAIVAAALAAPGFAATAEEPVPNVVLFVVDDLGWQDLSVPLAAEPTPFNRRYRTPNVERLAAEGVRFTNAYAASPVCTPTRASLMTGRSPARTGITYWILQRDRDTSAGHPALRAPEWNLNGLEPGRTTLASRLRDAGRRSIHVGKWHLGAKGTASEDPTTLGFTVNVAGHGAGGPGSHLGRDGYSAEGRGGGSVWDVPDLAVHAEADRYLTEALTIEACGAIDAAVADGVPFFLHVAHYAVHAPIQADPRFVANYPDLPPREAAYASMIEGVDASLGAILDRLIARGIASRTLVVFCSDNGGLSAHGRAGPPHGHNAPLRSGKGSAYEGGIRVPLVIRWPGVARAGGVDHAPTTTADLFATILAAAGAAPAPDAHDARDLGPRLRDPDGPAPPRDLHWHMPHFWGVPGPGIEPFSAIRRGDLKLIWFHDGGRLELYDLAADPGETQDLAAERPDDRRRLAAALAEHLRSVGAARSIDRATEAPVPWPDA